MRTSTTLPLAAAITALGLALAGCSSTTDHASTSGTGSDTASSAQPGVVSNDADVTFLTGMYPHHAQALEMTAMAPTRTTTPAVLALAEQISAEQQPEMDTMSSLLTSFGQPVPSSGMGSMSGMDLSASAGMMSADDMTALESLSGTAFDRRWLTLMVEHHTGAVEQAEAELRDGSNPDARALATAIVAAQQAEITTMNGLLQG